MTLIYIVALMAVAIWIYWYTVSCQKEDWSLGAIRAGSFLAVVVLCCLQVWYWSLVCVIVFGLSLIPSKPESSKSSEGGDVSNEDSH
jgi:hypothetical protein